MWSWLLPAIVPLLASVAPVAIGADTLGPRTARLRRSLTVDHQLLVALPVSDPSRVALLEQVRRRTAELVARESIKPSASVVVGLGLLTLASILLLFVAPQLPYQPLAFIGGCITYGISLLLLSLVAARTADLRDRQIIAILLGRGSGGLIISVSFRSSRVMVTRARRRALPTRIGS